MIWLPLPSFDESLKVLDLPELQDQLVSIEEALKILNQSMFLARTKERLIVERAIPWHRYIEALVDYGCMTVRELKERGEKVDPLVQQRIERHSWGVSVTFPQFLNCPEYNLSHRVLLLIVAKSPQHYVDLGWKV